MIKDNQKTLNRIYILIDALLILGAYFLAYPLRFFVLSRFPVFALAPGEGYRDFAAYANNAVFLVPGYLYLYSLCGLYRATRGTSRIKELGRVIEANILGLLYFAFLLYIRKEADISRWFAMTFTGLSILFSAGFRLILVQMLRFFRRRGRNLKHVLLVGYSRTAEGYVDRLVSHPEWGYNLYGILDDDMAVGTRYKKVPVIGSILDLPQIIEENDFDEIVISLGINQYNRLENIVNICEKSGVHTKFVPDYNNIISTVPYIEDLFGLPVINIRNVPLSNLGNAFIKRAMDILFGVLALIIFAIPMLIIAIAVKCSSKGPVFYSQVRVGRHGKEFHMLKFRSMTVQDVNSEKSEWTKKNDVRVTRVGKFIRKTSLDELPQLFNVIVGSMSLVGPRPERPQFVEKFREEIPRYMVKHQVRPGMTGWAQINGWRGDTSIKKRIEYDLYYIENWSVGLDIKILFLTIFKGFINKNAY